MPINGIETAYKDRYTFAPPSQRAAQWYTLPLRFIICIVKIIYLIIFTAVRLSAEGGVDRLFVAKG